MSPPTCGDHGCGGNPGDRYWGRGIGGGPVPELTLGVIPPARHGAFPEKRAAVSEPDCDRDCARGSGDRYWGRGIGGGPVPELTLGVIPPARHRAVRQDSTGVSCAGRDGDSAGDFGHYHWDRRILGGRASVNLTSFVVPPAADRVVRKNSA